MNFEKLVGNTLGTLFNQFARYCEYIKSNKKYLVKGVVKTSSDFDGGYRGAQVIVERTTVEVRKRDLPFEAEYGDHMKVDGILFLVLSSTVDEYGVCSIELGDSIVP